MMFVGNKYHIAGYFRRRKFRTTSLNLNFKELNFAYDGELENCFFTRLYNYVRTLVLLCSLLHESACMLYCHWLEHIYFAMCACWAGVSST